MAKRLLSTISLPALDKAPTGANVGELYYDTEDNTIHTFDGAVWNPVSIEYMKQMLVGGTHEGIDVRYDAETNTLSLVIEANEFSNEPSGFPDQDTSVISFNPTLRRFSLAPTPTPEFKGPYDNGYDYIPGDVVSFAGRYYVRVLEPNTGYDPTTVYWNILPESYVPNSFVVFCSGKKFIKTTEQTVDIPNVSGKYYIYFNEAGNLECKTAPFDFANDTPVAYVVWNQEESSLIYLSEERHGMVMDWATHYYLHRVNGPQLVSGGLSASDYTIGGDGTLNSQAQFSLTNGTIFDEDTETNITHSSTPTGRSEQFLQPYVKSKILYRNGNHWSTTGLLDYAVALGINSIPTYNLNTSGVWSNPELADNQYVAAWVVATNNEYCPVLIIKGQRADNNLNQAKDNNSYASLNLVGLPFDEFVPLYRIILHHSLSFTNTPKAVIADILDIRTVSGGATGATVNDHGNLVGLLDDDHTQYVHISNPRTIIAAHTFNPATPSAPFIIGPNASGQLVTGLNAEKVGGKTLSEIENQAFTYAQNSGADALAAAKGYTDQEIADLIGTAPGVLDTLGEIADALNDDANFASTITTQLAGKAPISHQHTTSDITNFTEAAQDAVSTLFTHSNHSNISAVYDDVNNQIIFTVSAQLTQEQIQDYVSPLLTHANHTNINATYDDVNNQIVLQAITEPSKAVMSASAPLNPADGAFWFDTDEYRTGNTRALKVWNALTSTWEYVSSDLSLSTTNVWTAKNTFNQGVIIGLSSAPATPSVGQVYYDTTLQNIRVWTGTQWNSVTGGGGGGAAFQLISTDTTLVPSIMFFGAAAPTSGTQNVGDLWVDIDDDAGSTEFIHVGPDAPSDYGTGTLWVDTDEPELPLIYSDEEPPTYTPVEGDFWVDIDDLAGQLVTVRETPPLPTESELWIDTATEEGLETFTVANVYEGNRSVFNTLNDLPDPATHGGMMAYVEANRSIYVSRVDIPEYTLAATFNITNSGMNGYMVNGVMNAPLILQRGKKYLFNINSPGHPFWIKTQQSTGTNFDWYYGITNNGTDNGTIVFNVPYNAPDTLYYICQYHQSMTAAIAISGTVSLTSSWEKIYPNDAYNQLEGMGYMGLL